MGLTDNQDDPRLTHYTGPEEPAPQAEIYLVLSDEELAKGFVRPVRRSYIHLKCGAVTTMGQAIAETYARDPKFYGATYCCACSAHFPVGANGEFIWDVPAPPFTTTEEMDTFYAQVEKVGT